MNNKYIFLILISLLIIPISVQSVTVSNSIFTATMKAGSSTSFNMVLTPDKGEDRVIFERIEVSGDQCAEWITVNKTNMDFTESTPVSAAINVPKTAINGLHKCQITYTAPAAGMVKMAIGVPVKINVREGIDPTPEPTPRITAISEPAPGTTISTIKPTATRTTVKPMITTIKPTAQAPAPSEYAPDLSFSLLIAVSLIITGVIGVFIALKMRLKK